MMAIVLVLASSAFWGLYSYRWLANGISQQAREIPITNNLSMSAETMRDAGHRLRLLRKANRSPEPHPLFGASRIDFESICFDDALKDFERALFDYVQLIDHHNERDMLFIDSRQRKDILNDICRQLEAVKNSYECPIIDRDEAAFESLQQELDSLANQTAKLTGMMHVGMAEYSADVRNRYQAGIAIAWSCLFAALSMTALLLVFFRSLVIKPFRTLLDGARLVAAGQFDHSIDLGTRDELSELAAVINQMTARFNRTCGMLQRERADLDKQVRDRSREVIQREQLASVGFLAAGVAHEINNPLASIAMSAEALESRLHDVIHDDASVRTLSADEARHLGINLRRVQDEAYRCKGITQRLLDFSRLGNVERSQVDIGELIKDVIAMVGTLGKYKCTTLQMNCDERITAYVNGQQIRQVALNLITNALESVDVDGEVTIAVARDADIIRVTVTDNGCEMTDEVREHLFEPFFTRRRDGTGNGLGLSITHRIITQHGGKLTAHSDGPGRGSRLQFEVPAEARTGDSLGNSLFAEHRHREELYEPLRVA